MVRYLVVAVLVLAAGFAAMMHKTAGRIHPAPVLVAESVSQPTPDNRVIRQQVRLVSRSWVRPAIRATHPAKHSAPPARPPAKPPPRHLVSPPPRRVVPRPVVAAGPAAIAQAMLVARGWASQWVCLQPMWQRESGWQVTAYNPSGAYGIPQALPGAKMASAGPDWRTDAATQIRWGLDYIAARYGTPCAAWAFWQAHHWY